MSCVRSRIIRRILPAPALFLALGAVLLCSVPALAADRTNPAGHTITANPGMEATANGDRLTNNGRIEATATGVKDAVGLGDSSFAGLQLTNSGTIAATALGNASGMVGGANSTLTNSGTITASASGSSAYGMRGGANSTLVNSGTITATSARALSSASGMWNGNDSTLVNSGTVTVSTTGNSDYAFGMRGGKYSTLVNIGTITASASTHGSAYGMVGSDNSTLVNSGTIMASSTGNQALGMQGDANSTLVNSGTVTATGIGDSAYGMDGGEYSTLTNSGTVTASATGDRVKAYGMVGGSNSTLANSGTVTSIATGATGSAYGMNLNSGTAANYGLIRVSAPNPANAWELYNRSPNTTDTVRITDWATDLRDFTTYKFFGSAHGGTLDFSGSTFILRPGDKERGFVWGKEYAVADMVDGNYGQGTVASATAEVPWLRARLTGTDWSNQKLSLHHNVTAKTNPGQRVSRQGVAIAMDQMRGMDRTLGQFRSSSAPVAFSTASGPDLGPDSKPDENGWSGFLTPYFSYVDNSDLDYDATIVGFMAGASRRFTERFSAGVHVGFSHAEVSADLADQNGDTLTGLLGLHAVYTLTPEWYVRGQLTGFLSRASNDWKSGLSAYPLYADADVDSRGVYASLNTGYDWRINESNTITPELGLSWLWSHQDAYSLNWEDHLGNRLSCYDLDYKAEDYTALYGTAMVRWQGAFALGDSVFRPSLGLGLRQTLTDNDIQSRLTTNGSGFSTRVSEDDTTALAEAGLAWQRGNTTLGFTYTGDYGSDQRVHAGWLTVKVAF